MSEKRCMVPLRHEARESEHPHGGQRWARRSAPLFPLSCCACVPRCRLWGKLQVLGLGTALKILLSRDDDAKDASTMSKGYSLRRNEIVALVNTLAQVT